jgi:hypothetical protein
MVRGHYSDAVAEATGRYLGWPTYRHLAEPDGDAFASPAFRS